MKIDYCVRRTGNERRGGAGYVNVGQRLGDYLGMSLHICMQLCAGKRTYFALQLCIRMHEAISTQRVALIGARLGRWIFFGWLIAFRSSFVTYRGKTMKRILSIFAVGVLSLSAHTVLADGIGTSVTGSLSFSGLKINFFDPANGGVPGGFGNHAGAKVTIGSGTEFGYSDAANLDTANFTDSSLTISDTGFHGGQAPFEMKFTGTDFTGFSLISNDLGVNFSFAGDTLTVKFAGGDFMGKETTVLSYAPNQGQPGVTPEPATLALLGTGMLAAAGVVRKRLIA
jgi:PEP-CTERM motif